MFFFFSSRRRHTRFDCDWSSDVCSSDLNFGSLATDPKFWNARFNLAEIPFLRKDWAEARKRFEGLLQGNASELQGDARSEERRVGKECRCRWSAEHRRREVKIKLPSLVG